MDANRFEKPGCFPLRPVEHVASQGGIIEQFDRQRLPNEASRALRCAERKQKNERDSWHHSGSVPTAARDASDLKAICQLSAKPM